MHGDFVKIADGFGGRRGDAAELTVINQLRDGRRNATVLMLPTNASKTFGGFQKDVSIRLKEPSGKPHQNAPL